MAQVVDDQFRQKINALEAKLKTIKDESEKLRNERKIKYDQLKNAMLELS